MSAFLDQLQAYWEKQNLGLVLVHPAFKYSMKPAEDDSNHLNDLSGTWHWRIGHLATA